jgi:hypothetical protein
VKLKLGVVLGVLIVTTAAHGGSFAQQEFHRGLALRCPERHLDNLDSVRRAEIVTAFSKRFPPQSVPETEDGGGTCVDVYGFECDYIHALGRAVRQGKMAVLVSMACRSGYRCTTQMGECRKVTK